MTAKRPPQDSPPPGWDRRGFLRAGLALLAAHGSTLPAGASERRRRAKPYSGPENPRILSLVLETSAPLDQLADWYRETLGIQTVVLQGSWLELQAGETSLVFITAEEGSPTYHVAFNIPENKIFEARTWLSARTPLLKRTPDAYSHDRFDDLTDFWHWDAHSVFFEDPAGNLLELIARHELPNATRRAFSERDVLYASEIGFVAGDVPALGKDLEAATRLPVYYSSAPYFHALGDPNGLLLVLQDGRNRWTGRPPWEVFPTAASIRDGTAGRHELAGFPYRLEAGIGG